MLHQCMTQLIDLKGVGSLCTDMPLHTKNYSLSFLQVHAVNERLVQGLGSPGSKCLNKIMLNGFGTFLLYSYFWDNS